MVVRGRGREGGEFTWMEGINGIKMLVRRDGLDLTGVSHVVATVRSMTERERSWTGQFRIDPGVVDCVVPRRFLQGIGLEPVGQRVYQLEGGEFERVDVTTAQVEVMGEVVGARVVMGDDESEAVLGRVVLEGVGGCKARQKC